MDAMTTVSNTQEWTQHRGRETRPHSIPEQHADHGTQRQPRYMCVHMICTCTCESLFMTLPYYLLSCIYIPMLLSEHFHDYVMP